MITSIAIHNIKCFETLSIPLTNLTLLSGINSMGKSTLIQSLLLMRQSYELNNLYGIQLNGPYTQIGTGKDLLNSNAGIDDEFSIKVTFNDVTLEQHINYNSESDFLDTTPQILKENQLILRNMNYFKSPLANSNEFNIFGDNFSFISAERISPKMFYNKSHYDVHTKKQLGIHGEYCIHYLLDYADKEVANKALYHEHASSHKLLAQTEAWLSEISPGISLSIEDYHRANMLGLQIRQSGKSGDINDEYKIVNVGFGISYILPVIVALLKADKDDLVIIENPEAHLHPKGQRKMGELIAKASSGGVQVIIETHSDHILNGIRLSVRNNKISPDKVNLYYFQKDAKMNSVYENPQILEDGRLNFWPDGFFDEWDKAIDEMF